MKINKILSLVCFCVTIFFSIVTNANQFHALNANYTSGNQSFRGSLGTDFNVLSDIVITELGAFDHNGDGLNNTITVRVYDRSNTSVPRVELTLSGSSDPLIGGYRYKSLPTPLTLSAGFQGSIVAFGYGNAERNGNRLDFNTMETGNGLVGFTTYSRYSSSTSYPTTTATGAERFGAGSFKFSQLSRGFFYRNDIQQDKLRELG